MHRPKKKKIIYLVTKANWGGGQKYVHDLATSLPTNTFDVLVVHGEGNVLNRKLQKVGVKTKYINSMGRDINTLSEILTLLKLFKVIFQEKPDIVHLNSSKAAGLGAFISRVLFVPKIIFTVHGWAFNEPRFDNKITRFLSWLTVLLSTDTIVMSKQNLNQTKNWPGVTNKFKLIYNGIGDINFKDRDFSRNFIAEITHTDKNRIWITTISELHKNKGLEYLIQAIAKIKEKPNLFIMGEGEERDNLEKLIQELNLENQIFLMGFIENASSYLKAFDIFTLTSIKEGHPYALLEAGLSKIGVVASDIPGISDILNNKKGVLVEAKNPNSIAKGIEKLISNPEKTAQLGSNLKKEVVESFSFKKTFKETLNLY